jgi:preprotein translocase subunit SecG
MMTFLYFTSIVLFLLLCILLCFVILIQESKSTGLGASFGGEASESLFGTSTADVLKKFTAWLAVIFLISCVLLSLWTAALGRSKNPASATPFTMEQLES